MNMVCHWFIKLRAMGFPLRFLSSLSLCLLALLLHRATVTSGCFSLEREALLDFKAGIHDTHNRLSSWVGQDCCAWAGVICRATTGHVVKLDLRNTNTLDGAIRDWFSSVNMLPSLQVLNMSYVGLDTIPASVVHVNFTSSLTVLDLSTNNFDSTLPKWLWNITSLTHLDLYYSGFHGVIPDAIGDLGSLTFLDLGVNQLEGTVPRSMVDLRRLKELHMPGNQLIGNLSDWLEQMTDLIILDLHYNLFNGSMPSSSVVHFENLTRLQVLDLSDNPITISIGQKWLQFQTQIQVLSMDYYLSNNQIGGKLPSSLNFTKLEMLYLYSNRFEGPLPMMLPSTLDALDLSNNSLTGQLPIWPHLDGDLCSSICQWTGGLVYLDLSSNKLLGEIPYCLGESLRNIYFLNLDNNHISGEIPHTIGFLMLRLRSNMFSGVVPWQLARFEKLQILDLANNNFSGSIPQNIGNLNLYYLQCSISLMKKIEGMKSLESLDLSINDLSGSIPESLSILYSLSYLNLSYNNLSGMITFGHQLQTFIDPSIYMGNADLCGPPIFKSCFNNKTIQNIIQEYKKEIPEWLWFYISMVLGYVMGFWTFCGILFLKDTWRHVYFHMIDDMYDRLWVQWHLIF
uniref:Leucine-rich repeat-containing N-terminal plant-type domain-containing protein n=1 Tax=Musa acuminata subsp. malaccensis TaxID=214687 RepID=A0A804KR21_MUSAM